ncbi:transcriptional regulator [Acuticoccus sediminis]|uniref:Transcriptional regulator n=1 Tax=Acuticoccus sediminis TaxID=2184697 RepID=A0A8B2NVT8_9HYPH|nr:IclR family transcriptional regulator [Acuticoccus sediminis]RAI02438.1 transcriptional regulator [Acuticoccus sediminis]
MTKTDNDVRRRQVPAVTRAIAILRRLARADEPLGVNELARELDMVPSTCLHILRVLQEEGFVSSDARRRGYSIDVGILPIANAALRKNTFATLVQAGLDDIAARFDTTCVATTLLEMQHMVVVALSEARMAFRLHVELGSRFPTLTSATGRCVAAFTDVDRKTLKGMFDRQKWDVPPTFDTWREEVEEARRSGYAVDRGNYISGVTVVAVPVFDAGGRMAHSIVAIGIKERVDKVGLGRLANALLELRDDLAARQGERTPVGR